MRLGPSSERVAASISPPGSRVWQRDELSRSAFRRRVRHYQREAREDLGYAFLIFRDADDKLLGGLTLSNVRRGVTQAAVLGYWLGLPYLKQGYMTEAVAAVAAFAFEDLHSAPARGRDHAVERRLDRRPGAQRLPI